MGNNKKGKKKQPPKESQAERTRREQAAAKKDAEENALLDKEVESQKNINDGSATKNVHAHELQMFRAMPKIELHAHLSGSLSSGTISKLVGNKDKCIQTIAKYRLQKPEEMKKVFESFGAVNEALEKSENLRIATIETCREFCEDGCIYLELRSTPKHTRFMDYETYLRTIVGAILEARVLFPQMKIFFIVGINRTMNYDTASHILHIVGVLQLESNVIVGLELSGDPKVYAKHLVSIFQVARRFHGLGVTYHLAETKDYTDDTLDYMLTIPDRIGHGTFLHTNKKLVEIVQFYKIPLELCLSSNVYTKTVPSPADSHFKYWRDRGIPVSINTDDKGIFPASSLSEEYFKVAKVFNLSMDEMITLNFNALRSSFGYKYSCTTFLDTFRKIGDNTLI
ncbi:hypothetical protein L5515_013774 [Caenorhabditis briggsae]|uniref:Adenosine deaminase domain-containing protein n=2 Tax=Caenorhabditis briggsae TaxID=6238 RepID=A0AAE9EBJ1_CAEBR|nr:hypothetical protein L5515_013774 [Caenorhabditis briggsae]